MILSTKAALTGTAVFSLLVSLSSLPASAEEAPRCDSSFAKSGEANIRACTAALQGTNLSNYERATILNVRGNNYDFLKKYDLAIADYTAVIHLRPDFEYGYANRGFEKCRSGDCKAALSDYDHAIKLNPKNAFILYGRGVARLRSGDAPGGHADIAAASKLDPDIAETYRQLGVKP